MFNSSNFLGMGLALQILCISRKGIFLVYLQLMTVRDGHVLRGLQDLTEAYHFRMTIAMCALF